MYHLDIYANNVLVCTVYGELDDLIYIVDNLKFSILYSFRFSKVQHMFTIDELYLLRMLLNAFRPVRNFLNVHYCSLAVLEFTINSLDNKLNSMIDSYKE